MQLNRHFGAPNLGFGARVVKQHCPRSQKPDHYMYMGIYIYIYICIIAYHIDMCTPWFTQCVLLCNNSGRFQGDLAYHPTEAAAVQVEDDLKTSAVSNCQNDGHVASLGWATPPKSQDKAQHGI